MKIISIDKDMLIQLKHPIKLTELEALNTLLTENYCIEIYVDTQSNKRQETTIYTKEELKKYLKDN